MKTITATLDGRHVFTACAKTRLEKPRVQTVDESALPGLRAATRHTLGGLVAVAKSLANGRGLEVRSMGEFELQPSH